jgi:cobalt-zinc-cadmium resistance protein CzcA
MFEGERRFDITVRYVPEARIDPHAIGRILVPTRDGGRVPLEQLAAIKVVDGASIIARRENRRQISVRTNIRGRDQGSFVAEAMEKVGAKVILPPGYSMTWGGQFENQQRAIARLKIIIPVSVFLIFVLLFWAFGSIRQAVLVLLMVPFTLIGGLAGLALAGLHLSVSAAVGFIAVAGISVQNGVIMVEQFAEIMRNGKSLAEAVMEGAVSRLRPIVMTALMAGLGLLPAALSHGIGSETQRPFAVVIVGGIVSATFFTLLLLPLLFPLFAKERRNIEDEDEDE